MSTGLLSEKVSFFSLNTQMTFPRSSLPGPTAQRRCGGRRPSWLPWDQNTRAWCKFNASDVLPELSRTYFHNSFLPVQKSKQTLSSPDGNVSLFPHTWGHSLAKPSNCDGLQNITEITESLQRTNKRKAGGRYMYVCIYLHISTLCPYIHIWTDVCKYVFTYVCIAIYADIYRYMHIQTHPLNNKCALRKSENNFIQVLAYIKQNRKWGFGLLKNYFKCSLFMITKQPDGKQSGEKICFITGVNKHN